MYGGGGLVAQSCPAVVLATPWTVALQIPLSMGFPGKSTGMGCHFLLQRIFPAQCSNLGILHCRWILYQLSYQGSPSICCCAVTESCLTPCDPMDCSIPGFPVLHYLLIVIVIQSLSNVQLSEMPRTPGFPVLQYLPVCLNSTMESVMPSNHLILCRLLLLLPSIFPSIRVFSK